MYLMPCHALLNWKHMSPPSYDRRVKEDVDNDQAGGENKQTNYECVDKGGWCIYIF